MTDNEIKCEKCFHQYVCEKRTCAECVSGYCDECELYSQYNEKPDILNCEDFVDSDLIKRQQAKIDRLEYTLLGVMHFVDKWLDDAELEQDEINRAGAMREKTLQIVEKLEEENDFLKSIDTDKIKAEAIKEFARALRQQAFDRLYVSIDEIDNLVKEMVGEHK